MTTKGDLSRHARKESANSIRLKIQQKPGEGDTAPQQKN